jgi:calcineurin-like phosphoesterase family protein
MNKDIVEKWNSVVEPDDIVFHLGDVGFGLVEQLKPLVESLNGHKILIRGNHDMKRGVNSWSNIGFERVYKKGKVTLNQLSVDLIENNLSISGLTEYDWDKIIFSHNPVQCNDDEINVHGHIHNVPLDTTLYNPNNHICASVEMIDYKPIRLESLLEIKKN